MASDIDISSWPVADQERYHELSRKVKYYDQIQYIFKIKLNSLYGALLNKYFRFFDARMGESTTGTGRAILRHQCGTVNQFLTGVFDPEGDAIYYGDTDSSYFNALFGVDKTDQSFDHLHAMAIERADATGEHVNASFPEFMRTAFLCTDGFDDKVKAAREVVFPRGIFVTKKRYVLWVTDNEGKATDKLKVMGLDTKKTILPKYIRVALNGFIERFLKGTPWEDIAKDVVAFKDDLLKQDIMTLGIPKGVNKVEHYTQLFEEDQATRLPGHVRASIHFNQQRTEFNDVVTTSITSGMKIKVFYLKRPEGKTRSIAFPVDEEFVPDWFRTMNIDPDAQVTRLVDKPLDNILKAMGKEPPSHQTLFVDTVLEF